jgi:outer membrane protein OmpA-like peptidoglycan-associated protein
VSVNLIELAKSYLSTEVLNQLGGALGESPERLEKAASAGLPAILAGMLKKASTPSGAGSLSDMMKHDAPGLKDLGGLDGVLGNLGSFLGGGSLDVIVKQGQTILNALFGGNLSSVIDVITRASGIKTGSASSLMGMLAPMLLGLMKRQLGGHGLSASGLTDLLMSQKDTISRFAPPELSSALGLSSLSDLGSKAAALGSTATRAATKEAASALPSWLLPVAGLAALLLLGFFLMRGGSEEPQPAPTAPPVVSAPTTKPAPDPARTIDSAGRALEETAKKLVSVPLPGNAHLDAPEGSFLHGLVKSLTNAADATLPKSFAVNGLRFNEASNSLDSESSTTLDGLATVLKAFGSAKLKITGFDESAGTPEANKAKSLELSNTVKDSLVKAGVPPERITAEGMGSDRPTGDGGRAKGRRIEISIVSP